MSFGDVRVAERADWLIERVATAGTLVLRKLGETRAGEKAVHRFLSSPYVSVDRIVETLAARTALQCAGRRVLAVQDTTEINFSGRDKKRRGFGPAGDGITPGFFIHPVIAVDIESEAIIGLVDAHIWTRPKRKQNRRSRPFEEKESARWVTAPKVAADLSYQNAKENTPHTARMAHDQALGKVMQHLLKDDTQVYKQFVENESFKRFVSDMVYGLTSS